MVKVTSISSNPNTHKALVSLFSDTKAEVSTTEPSDIEGFPTEYTIDVGSSVMTADADVAFMKSDGSWNWV